MDELIVKTRPKPAIFLMIICSLSIIANLTLISINFLLLFWHSAMPFLLNIPIIDIITEEEMHGDWLYFTLNIDLHAFCIFSLIMIWQLKRMGLYFYIISQLILTLLPFVFLKSLGMSYLLMSTGISIVFSVFFILLFSMYLPSRQGKQ